MFTKFTKFSPRARERLLIGDFPARAPASAVPANRVNRVNHVNKSKEDSDA